VAKKPSIKGKGADIFFGDKKPVKQQTGKPASQQASKMVKATFYLTNEANIALEKIKLKRLENGEKIDKSSLIVEAVQLLKDKYGL